MVNLIQNNQALDRYLTPTWNKYIPIEPTPKQLAFLLLDDVKDVFYGGAAGGGKSVCLLAAALQFVHMPGYKALLLRSNYQELSLPGAIMDMSHEWLNGTDAKWSEKQKKWKFPDGGVLQFGYLEKAKDHLRYKGSEFHFIGVDEASDLLWMQIKYMLSRLRRSVSDPIPLRFRLASNPGGVSHEDLFETYVDPETRAEGKIFIPAGIQDNSHLNAEEYIENLMELDSLTRRQLLDGDWSAVAAGDLLEYDWFKTIPAVPEDRIVKRLRWWDLAATEKDAKNPSPDYTASVRMSLDHNGIVYVEDVTQNRSRPQGVEDMILDIAEDDPSNTEIWMEEEPGSSGKYLTEHFTVLLKGYFFKGQKSTGDKETYAKPFSSYSEQGKVKLVRADWNKRFLNELISFPFGKHDDMADAGSKGFCKLTGKGKKRAGTWGRK